MTTEPTAHASADVGKYHSYLNEIAEIVESGGVYPSEVPGKVRELVERLRGDVERLDVAWRKMRDERDTVSADLWESTKERDAARAEIAKLQQALSVAERHDADIRLEAEADVRAELAEKVGA